jgi:hypothetical protein
MPHKPTGPQRFLLNLLIFSFVFGMGGKTSFCFMPDGGIHLEESHFSCSLDPDHSLSQEVELCCGDSRQGPCRDITLGVDASGQQQRCPIQLTTPVMLSLGPPIPLALTENKPLPPLPPAHSSQLHTLQTVVLLI